MLNKDAEIVHCETYEEARSLAFSAGKDSKAVYMVMDKEGWDDAQREDNRKQFQETFSRFLTSSKVEK